VINRLEREITELVGQVAPRLLTQPGFGPPIAAKLVGEIAGAQRFATPAKPARAAGVAPIPASSGNTRRQRLDQGGNRQINAALHRVIVTRALSATDPRLHRTAPPRRQAREAAENERRALEESRSGRFAGGRSAEVVIGTHEQHIASSTCRTPRHH
jgi:transposase